MEIKQGQFLLATSALKNSYFENTIIFLVEHSDLGTYGLIINKACSMPINEVFTDTPTHIRGNQIFHIGGPVDENLIQILHINASAIENPKEIHPDVYIGTQFVKEGARAAGALPSNEKIFLGYSGWGADQLKEEIAQGCWNISEVDPVLVFHEYTPLLISLTPENFNYSFGIHDS